MWDLLPFTFQPQVTRKQMQFASSYVMFVQSELIHSAKQWRTSPLLIAGSGSAQT